MRLLLYILLVMSAMPLFWSCSSDEQDFNSVEFLRSENLRKDSMVTESITYFNEIERNLSSIELKEKEIEFEFGDIEGQGKDDKEIILKKIAHINELRLENEKKIRLLENKLDKIDIAKNQFKVLLRRLQNDIKKRDKEIAQLQKKLMQKDREYGKLFADYQYQLKINKTQGEKFEEVKEDLNTVYYVSGTEKELKSSNIITTVKRKISAKRVALNTNVDESHFNVSDMADFKEITVQAKKITLITDHPESSYQIIEEGKRTIKIKIVDAALFWKVSRYLVVMTE